MGAAAEQLADHAELARLGPGPDRVPAAEQADQLIVGRARAPPFRTGQLRDHRRQLRARQVGVASAVLGELGQPRIALPVRGLRSAVRGGGVGWRGLAGRLPAGQRALAGSGHAVIHRPGATRRLFAWPAPLGRRRRGSARTAAWPRLPGRTATGCRLPIRSGRAAAGRTGVAGRLLAWPAPGSRRLRHGLPRSSAIFKIRCNRILSLFESISSPNLLTWPILFYSSGKAPEQPGALRG